MGQPISVPPPGFDQLTPDEQIEYVQALWDRIAASPDRVPVEDWHRDLVDQRLAEHEASPDDSVPWEEARAKLEAKYRSTR